MTTSAYALHWLIHGARRPDVLLLYTPSRRWRRQTGGQLKTWATAIKTDLEPLSGPRVFGHT